MKSNNNKHFQRCTEEQEARFNSLTATIRKSQTVAVPQKQTKLAYVNVAVKPPRDVIKKQVNSIFCLTSKHLF